MGRFDPLAALAAQRGQLFPWTAVCLGAGVGLYFWLPAEPRAPALAGAACLAAACAVVALRGPERLRPLAWALALVAAGVVAGGVRSRVVAAQVLPYRSYGPVEGRVVKLDRSASGNARVTLDRVTLARVAPAETPARVRVSLLTPPGFAIVPGQRLRLTALLGPPQGPALPGGFDFQRYAWFRGLGAVGYARAPPELTGPPRGGAELFFARLRQRIADAVRARIPGDAGGFVAAILTNDTSGLSAGALNDLRVANLAHMLAISGLHMALVTGFVFAALRHGLALVPPLALRLPTKKIAAALALPAAAFYLALSGAAVATERSFVMVSVMLVAVLFDRRAISLRSVALSALIVLTFRPESLTEAGFQMSYAATLALIASFEALGVLGWRPSRLPRGFATVGALALSSMVAGLATAPFAAAYFGRVSSYGLLANLLAMPVMGLVEMPGAVVAGLLSPPGLERPALWLVGQGARWILAVAHLVAGLPGAARLVPAPPAPVLPLLAAGALWLLLWQGRARGAGLVVAVLALGLWATARPPAILVAGDGSVVGVEGAEGLALSKAGGSGFTAHAWLQAAGAPLDAEAAAARAGFAGPKAARAFEVAGLPGMALSGTSAGPALVDLRREGCGGLRLVVAPARMGGPGPAGCQVLDAWLLARTGALAGYLRGGRLVWRAARQVQGDRPWTRAGRPWPVRIPPLPPLKTEAARGAEVAALR